MTLWFHYGDAVVSILELHINSYSLDFPRQEILKIV